MIKSGLGCRSPPLIPVIRLRRVTLSISLVEPTDSMLAPARRFLPPIAGILLLTPPLKLVPYPSVIKSDEPPPELEFAVCPICTGGKDAVCY